MYPATYCNASSRGTFRAFRPITNASSTSWSVRRSGMQTGTPAAGPTSELVAFRNSPSA